MKDPQCKTVENPTQNCGSSKKLCKVYVMKDPQYCGKFFENMWILKKIMPVYAKKNPQIPVGSVDSFERDAAKCNHMYICLYLYRDGATGAMWCRLINREIAANDA